MIGKRVYRNIQSFLLLTTILVLGSAFYFEYAQGLQPCPLCLMQRLCTFLFGTLCLMGMGVSTLKRARHVAFAQMLLLLSGLFFALRQLWLQSLPVEQSGMCMPGLNALMHYFSWDQVMKALLWGTASCAEVPWRYLGLSMPGWSALYFSCAFIVCALVFWWAGRSLRQLNS